MRKNSNSRSYCLPQKLVKQKGVTRSNNKTTRWIDQGNVEAIELIKVQPIFAEYD